VNSAASLDNLLATVVGAGEFVVLFLSLINVVVCAFFCFLLYKLVATFWGIPGWARAVADYNTTGGS
jgi:hypothetical protein